MHVLGIDVGGANLKFASTDGHTMNREFPLWQRREQLAAELRSSVAWFGEIDAIALTMTGELADCYALKREGVLHVTTAMQAAVSDLPIHVYGVDGVFYSPESLEGNPLLAASANWHAGARFASAWLPNATGVWIDMGSTTTDIIPVVNGEVATRSQTDIDRLLAGELIYTGLVRTLVPCIVDHVTLRGQKCPLAAELFATTADVNALLGFIEFGSQIATADGGPLTRDGCLTRLARTICGDRELLSDDEIMAIATAVNARQREQVMTAIEAVRHRTVNADHVVISGGGLPWQDQVFQEAGMTIHRLSRISPAQRVAFCALAVASLLHKYLVGEAS